MVANIVNKPSRRLINKSLRLIFMRRVFKRVEALCAKVRDEVHDLMDTENLDAVKLPSGSITRYDSEIHNIDARQLYEQIGDEAFKYMRVNVSDAKKEIGETELRDIMKVVATQRKLLTKGNPPAKKIIINA